MIRRKRRVLHVPDRDLMVMTNEDDPVAYYYKPLTGWLYRRRLKIGLALLGDEHRQRILEIGYGSGILLPTLAARCDELYGVDLHENAVPVQVMLTQEGVQAELSVGSVLALSYPDRTFDAVVCLSVLEHLMPSDLMPALIEVRRVLQPGGTVVCGFPVRNVVTSMFYQAAGFDPAKLHPSGHQDIVAAVQGIFEQACVTWFPRWLPMELALYVGVRGGY